MKPESASSDRGASPVRLVFGQPCESAVTSWGIHRGLSRCSCPWSERTKADDTATTREMTPGPPPKGRPCVGEAGSGGDDVERHRGRDLVVQLDLDLVRAEGP